MAKRWGADDTINVRAADNVAKEVKALTDNRGVQAAVDFVDDEESHAAADPAVRMKALEAENAKLKAQISVLLQQISRLTEE